MNAEEMSTERISLQDAFGNLVRLYAEQALRLHSMAPSDLYEVAVSQAMDAALSSVFRMRGLPTYSPVSPPPSSALQQLEQALTHLADSEDGIGRIAANLGTAFEIIRGYRVKVTSSGSVQLETSPERRGKGIYFTPVELADAIVAPALNRILQDVNNVKDLRQVSILDPAAGCGAFLLAAVRVGANILASRKGFRRLSLAQIRAEIASSSIFGVDIDPLAIATTRALLRAEVGLATWGAEDLDKHLHVADAISASMRDWASWFPQVFPKGFSLVVTNPPWSKLRPMRSEFFEHIDARVRLYQGTELGRYLSTHLHELVNGDWSDHSSRMLELSRQLRKSPEYTINDGSVGDADLYKYFTERSLALLNKQGVAALLLPSGVLRAQGSFALRNLLRTGGQIKQLVEYINRQKLFDIHSMYRFCTVLFEKGRGGGIKHASFGVEKVISDRQPDSIQLSLSFLASVGGQDMLIPEVRTSAERELLYRMYSRYPTVGQACSGWVFSFKRELDMTNDAEAFISVDTVRDLGYSANKDGRWISKDSDIVLLPVYEGRMVHQFDPIAKAYVSGQGRSSVWTVPPVLSRQIIPHYFVSESYATERGWYPIQRVGYCEISGHANERTLLAALLPANCICGNKVPVLRIQDGTIEDQLLWLAYANSLVVDWIMRRFVSTTINQFFWQNIPLPSLGESLDAEACLVDAARMLSIPCGNFQNAEDWLGHRALIRAAIDVIVMHMYGLTDIDRLILLDDFPQLKVSHLRGAEGSISLAELLSKASRALHQNRLDINSLEASLGCMAIDAAAAYTPRDQSTQLRNMARSRTRSLPP